MKVPPLAIAFMKGHVGCADLLLEDPNVDVNFRDEDGWTIVMLTVGQLIPEMWEQLMHLVEEKNASVTLKDANDWTAVRFDSSSPFESLVDHPDCVAQFITRNLCLRSTRLNSHLLGIDS